MKKETKKEMIKELIGREFNFTDYGMCGLMENGDVVHCGEVCNIYDEDKDRYVKANLYNLPKKWTLAVQHSVLCYDWADPDDEEYMKSQTLEMFN